MPAATCNLSRAGRGMLDLLTIRELQRIEASNGRFLQAGCGVARLVDG